MTRPGKELIIELERVRVVRRRVATVRMFCSGCSEYGDFFEIPMTDHLAILDRFSIHTESSSTGVIHVCSRSLLALLKRRNRCPLEENSSE